MIHEFRIFPRAASTIAPQVDAMFWVLFGLSAMIVIGVGLTITVFIARYYKAPISVRRIGKRSRLVIEVIYTILPFFAFLGMFAWGAYAYFKMHVPPPDSSVVYVVSKQWMWKFQHADGIREINTLHIPVGKPIKLIMSSEDVIHSLFIPAFRVKQDVVPGRYTYMWFEATEAGHFHLFCSQYCGTLHSRMRGEVIAMKPQDFQRWEETRTGAEPKLGPVGLAARGRALFTRLGCISCHGRPLGVTAPDLHGIYMSKVHLNNGQTVIADDDYIRESILNPSAKIVMGYRDIMPSFQGQVHEEDLLELISYLKTLRNPERKP